MIEIKCTQGEKEFILEALATSSTCILTGSCNGMGGCKECLDKNIKWVITEKKGRTAARELNALIQKLNEENSASGQQSADEKAQAGSSQHINGVAGSSQGGKKMKVYIAGAITDNPNYKEQFNNAEERLKEAGYEVINPAKNQGYSYREYINAGLFQLMNCDAIYLLKGYERSTGATLEHNYAMSVGIKVMKEDSTTVEDIKGLLSFLELCRNTSNDSVVIKGEHIDILCEVLEGNLVMRGASK